MRATRGSSDRDHRKGKLRAFLLAQMERINETAAQHQWPWEIRRWHELVFCLLSTLGAPPLATERARVLTYLFADLGLLDIDTLASALSDHRSEEAGQLFDVGVFFLEREGFSHEHALRTMTSLAEAASSIQTRYEGHIQRYLRAYGVTMMGEISQHFSFTKLTDEERDTAFTYWIQNVLNMPIGVASPAVKNLCGDFGITMNELHEVADDLGINLGLLDDIVSDMGMLAGSQSAS